MRWAYLLFVASVYGFARDAGLNVSQLTTLMLPLVVIGYFFVQSNRRSKQAIRDWKASEVSRLLVPDGEKRGLSAEDEAIETELLDCLSEDAPPMHYLVTDRLLPSSDHLFDPDLPLILYLRPFAFDGKIMVPNPDASPLLLKILFPYRWIVDEKVNLEEWMALEFGKQSNFVAIGRPGEVLGAGKVETSDDEWRNEFVRLATRADAIISVPAMYESTLWELEWIAGRRMFGKTLMIFTELHVNSPSPPFRLGDLESRLAGYGWSLPEGITSSSIVTFDPGGNHEQHLRKTRFRKKRWPEAVVGGRR